MLQTAPENDPLRFDGSIKPKGGPGIKMNITPKDKPAEKLIPGLPANGHIANDHGCQAEENQNQSIPTKQISGIVKDRHLQSVVTIGERHERSNGLQSEGFKGQNTHPLGEEEQVKRQEDGHSNHRLNAPDQRANGYAQAGPQQCDQGDDQKGGEPVDALGINPAQPIYREDLGKELQQRGGKGNGAKCAAEEKIGITLPSARIRNKIVSGGKEPENDFPDKHTRGRNFPALRFFRNGTR